MEGWTEVSHQGFGMQRDEPPVCPHFLWPHPRQAWMEHRYLLSKEDLLQRPRWAAAVGGATLLLPASATESGVCLNACFGMEQRCSLH